MSTTVIASIIAIAIAASIGWKLPNELETGTVTGRFNGTINKNERPILYWALVMMKLGFALAWAGVAASLLTDYLHGV